MKLHNLKNGSLAFESRMMKCEFGFEIEIWNLRFEILSLGVKRDQAISFDKFSPEGEQPK